MLHYDVAIIGGGPAGYKAAEFLGNSGRKVCLIEKSLSRMGGTCLNEGCIPMKSWVEAAHQYKIIASGPFAVQGNLSEGLHPGKIREFSDKNIDIIKKGLLSLLKSKKTEIIYGTAVFKDSRTLEITGENNGMSVISAEHIIIASGSSSRELKGIAADHHSVCDSRSMLQNTTKLNDLLIIGGGVIGCEFASVYHELGTKVTVVEIATQLLPGEDSEVSRTLQREFKKQGIEVLTEHKVLSLEKLKDGVKVFIENTQNPDEKTEKIFSRVLLSVGRAPNTEGLNLNAAGIEQERGYIKVNQNYQTSNPNIYAIGDVIDTPMLAHAAYKEAELAAEHILTGQINKSYSYEYIPRIVFSTPQVGAAGMTEDRAKTEGLEYAVYKKFFKAIGKAVISGDDSGFLKIIAEKKTGRLLGASIIGISATEIIHTLIVAMEGSLDVSNLKQTVFGHPTLSEIIAEALHA